MADPARTSASPPPPGRGLRHLLSKNARALSFIPRERRFYELFEQQASVIVSSAGLLERALADGADLPTRRREIKALEHKGDELTHEIVRTLNRTFVTPFDHEDIYTLASGLDDILDYIEEVADTANLYGITTIPEPARELAGLLARAVAHLERAIGKLESGKGIASTSPTASMTRRTPSGRRSGRARCRRRRLGGHPQPRWRDRHRAVAPCGGSEYCRGLVAPEGGVAMSMLIVVLFGAITWNLITWWAGLPSSSSHALIGALIGMGLAVYGVGSVQWGRSTLSLSL